MGRGQKAKSAGKGDVGPLGQAELAAEGQLVQGCVCTSQLPCGPAHRAAPISAYEQLFTWQFKRNAKFTMATNPQQTALSPGPCTG